MELWFPEEWLPGVKLFMQISDVVYKTRTKFQDLAIYDTVGFGRVLVLDNAIQTAAIDEHLYHETIVHTPLFAHPDPKDVLIVGGGDGGSLREALKHEGVKSVTLVDIDEGVIDASRRFLPQWNTGFSHPKAKVVIADAVDFVAHMEGAYDVVIVDSTDPVGPGQVLFSEGFYRSVKRALRPDGIMAAQTENDVLQPDILRDVFQRIARIFPVARIFTGPTPTYPGGLWCYSCGSLGPDPSVPKRVPDPGMALRRYSPEIHAKSFVLHPETRRIIGEKD